MPIDTNPQLLQIIDDLAEQGWSQQNRFIAQGLTLELAAECRRRAISGELAPAGTGRGQAQAVREGIRGDRIQWLEPGESAACDRYLAAMDTLRLGLNAALYLGLDDYESHFALYPPGACYHKHLDRFRDDDRRVVSAVLYLNQDWQAEQGGALRLYLDQEQTLDIAPLTGRLVLFMSDRMPHEVLPATHERLSLTGWFRRRGDRPLFTRE